MEKQFPRDFGILQNVHDVLRYFYSLCHSFQYFDNGLLKAGFPLCSDEKFCKK